MDYFDQLPDDVILHILDLVSDVHALFRLRTLSHRFNSLATTKTQLLFLQLHELDKLFGTDLESDYYSSSFIKTSPPHVASTNHPSQNLLRCFSHVTRVVIELPAGDGTKLSPDREVKHMFKVSFGKNLKGCTILICSTERYCEHNVEPRSRFMRMKMQLQIILYALLTRVAYSVGLKLVQHLENLVSLVVKDSERGLAVAVAVEPHVEEFDEVEEADLARCVFGRGVHGMAIQKSILNSRFVDST